MATTHRVAVIRQVTNALRKTFDADYPDPLFQNLYTGPNFQLEQEKYPAVYVAYQENSIKMAGMGHRIEVVDDTGMDRILNQGIALGALQFTVMALNPYERDTLLDILLDVIMFSKYTDSATKKAFWKEISDEDFIWLTLNTETLQPGGVSSLAAPWQSENDLLFTGSYAINSECEFFSDHDTSEFVPINKIRVLPYRQDQEVPTGANDPAPWS